MENTENTVNEDKTLNVPSGSESSGLTEQGLAALLDQAIPELSGSTQAGTPELDSDSGEIQNEDSGAQGFNTLDDVVGTSGEEVTSEENSGNEPDSEERQTEEDDDDLPKGVRKRLNRLAAKKREAEERLKQAEQELENLRASGRPPAKDDNPFSNIQTESELQSAAEKARQVRDWCEENPYGGTIQRPNGEVLEIDEREVRRMKVQALRDIETNIPKQASNIAARKQFEPIAEQTYPWWKKKDSKEYKTAQALINNFPELAKFPDYKLVVGDFIFGMTARQARQAKNAPQARAPIQPSRPSTGPISQPRNQQKATEVEQRFTKTRSRDDLASLIESRFFGAGGR